MTGAREEYVVPGCYSAALDGDDLNFVEADRVNYFGNVNTYIIENCLIIPIRLRDGLMFTNCNKYCGVNPLNRNLAGRMDNMEYKDGRYTTEDYQEFDRQYKGLE